MKLPMIGGRIIKSAIAILGCLLLSLLHNNAMILLLSCISSILCIQQDSKHAFNYALQQASGIIYACILGFIFVVIQTNIHLIIYYFLVACAIVFIIYGLVVFKAHQATQLACFVFLFISLGNIQYWEVMLYFVGALTGVFVASTINIFHLPYQYQKDAMFVCALEHALLQDNQTISNYSKLQLKELLEKDANIMLMTSKSVGAVFTTIQDLDLKYPVVTLNGAASYDLKQQKYVHIHYMSEQALKKYYELINKYEMNAFIHQIHYDMLHIYYQHLNDKILEEYYHQKRKTPYDHYIHLKEQTCKDVVSILVLAPKVKLNEMIKEMKESGLYYEFSVSLKPYNEEYSILEVRDLNASKKRIIEQIYDQTTLKRLYVFASQIQDIELMGYATKAFVCRNANKHLFEYGEKILSNQENGVIHKLKQLYYHKNAS